MSIFPQAPQVGQTFESEHGAVWRWDGQKWPGRYFERGGNGGGGGGPGGDFMPRGKFGWFSTARDFDGPGLPSLQQWIDTNVNNHWFAQEEDGNEFMLVIDQNPEYEGYEEHGPRTTPISIKGVFMPNMTLAIRAARQFASTLTISGLVGALDIGSNCNWGSSTNFATTISLQSVAGPVVFSGYNDTIRFGAIHLFNCPDVRMDPHTNKQISIATELVMANSNVRLEGQGTSSHNYTVTHMDGGSRLDIAAGFTGTVNLGTGRRDGWILDRRTANALGTFARRT